MKEGKMELFLSMTEEMQKETGFDLFEYGLTAPISELLFGTSKNMFQSLVDSTVKLDKNEWNQLEDNLGKGVKSDKISLPLEIETEILKRQLVNKDLVQDEISF